MIIRALVATQHAKDVIILSIILDLNVYGNKPRSHERHNDRWVWQRHETNFWFTESTPDKIRLLGPSFQVKFWLERRQALMSVLWEKKKGIDLTIPAFASLPVNRSLFGAPQADLINIYCLLRSVQQGRKNIWWKWMPGRGNDDEDKSLIARQPGMAPWQKLRQRGRAAPRLKEGSVSGWVERKPREGWLKDQQARGLRAATSE